MDDVELDNERHRREEQERRAKRNRNRETKSKSGHVFAVMALANYCKHGSIFRATLAKMLTLVVLLSIVGQSSVVAIESIDIETTQQDDLGWDNTSPEDIHPSTVNRVSNSPPIIERLNEMRRNDSLRGSQKATAFSELKEVTRSTLTEVRALLNGDEDFDIKTYLESTASESKALQKLQGQVPDGLEDLRGQVISPKELSNQFNIIQKQSGIDIEAAVEHTLHLLEDNESYFLSQYDSEPRRLNSDHQENQQERTKLNFNPHVGTSPNIHNIIRQAHSEGRKHMRHAHKQKSNVKTSDRRRHLEESGTCPVPCTLDDTVCNCKKLHACASAISLYDLSAMYLNGYIEDDGNVTTQLNLFDANLPQKMADIDEILSAWDDSRDIRDDSTSCAALLQKFHVPCKFDTCSTANDQSYQLTIDEVCAFVGTPTKVLMGAIENTLDGLTSSDQLDQLQASAGKAFMDYLDTYVADKWGMNVPGSYKYPTFISDGKLPPVISGNDHAEVYFYEEELSTNSWSLQKKYCADRGKRLCTLEEIFPIRTYYGSARYHTETWKTNKNIVDFPYHTYDSNGIWRSEDTWVAYEGGYTQILNTQDMCPTSSWVQAGTWGGSYPSTGWTHAELLACGGSCGVHGTNYCAAHASTTSYFNKGIVCCDNTQVSLRAVEEEWNGRARADTRTSPTARKVKIHHPDGNSGYIELVEVEVFDENGINRAAGMNAHQSSTFQDSTTRYIAAKAVDGINFGNDFTTTKLENGALWEVDLDKNVKIKEIRLYLRNDILSRLNYAKVSLLSQEGDLIAMYNLGNIPGKQSKGGIIKIDTKTGIMKAANDNYVIEYINGGHKSPPIDPPTIDPALKGTSSECSSVSFDICKQFILKFDQIYQGRNKTDYPKDNPMLGNSISSAELSTFIGQDIFNHVNIPISYSHSQDDHGVTTLDGYVNANLAGFPGEQGSRYINGIWTMKQDKNWARCSTKGGDTTPYGYNYGCGQNVEILADSTQNNVNVKCCSDTLSDNFKTRYTSLTDEKLSTCPYRLIDDDQCPGKMTHEDAVEYCDSKGGRLCSSEELRNGCVNTGGCEFDLIWTAYTYEYAVKTDCYSGQFDATISNKAMNNCDASMALLAGQLSVGALGNIAKALEDEGPSAMPGSCCLDTPSDSQYLGYDFDPAAEIQMACQNRGPWHLGLSAEACENANGKYFRSPCISLQACIQNRPAVNTTGYSKSFEDWVRGTRPEGTCLGLAANATEVKCTSNHGCRSEVTNSSSSECDLEDWSGGFVINDAADEYQCRTARSALNFDQDYADDVDVCEEFEAFKCDDSMFEELDDLSNEQRPPLSFESVGYTTPAYPDLEELPFNKLPDKDDSQTPSEYKEEGRDAHFAKLLLASRTLEQVAYINQIKYEVHTEQGDALCNTIPTALGFNPGTVACTIANLIAMIITFIVWQIAETAHTAIRYMYEDATASAEQEYNGYIASVATYDELKNYMPWSVEALGVMNVNMVEQHIEMTKVLQKRHTQMEININTYNMCAFSHLGISLTQIITKVNGYPAKVGGLSRECRRILGLADGDQRRRALQATGNDEPSESPSSSNVPTEQQIELPEVFIISLLNEVTGEIITTEIVDDDEEDDVADEESDTGIGGNEPISSSTHDIVTEILNFLKQTSSPSPSDSPSSISAKWYVDWIKYTCVQDCDEDKGSRCGGTREWGDLHDTLEKCCRGKLSWKKQNCLDHISGGSDTTRHLKEKPQVNATPVMTEMEGLDIIKNMEGRLEDVGNVLEGKMDEMNDVIRGDVDDMKGRIATIENDMREIKALLTQLVHHEKEEDIRTEE